MRRLLWIGDAACDSGFARATHYTLEGIRKEFDVAVLGLNYTGDPHRYPYPIFPARSGVQRYGDLFGVARTFEVCSRFAPDVVVIQNDPWNIPRYVEEIKKLQTPPVIVGAVAIDGKNCMGENLNGLDHCIFWTGFAELEAKAGGYTKPSSIVPLGVDMGIYHPGDRTEARKKLGWDAFGDQVPIDAFVFTNVNRNQPRKRLDLTFKYFADFFHNHRAENAFLYLHVAPTGDAGYDCKQFTKYYGLKGHVVYIDQGVYNGASEEELALTYRASDVVISTTQGEGWGLTTLEAMASGIPCIVPDWSALGEWAVAAHRVKCSTTAATPNYVNVLGGVPDQRPFVHAMNWMYRDKKYREQLGQMGHALASEDRFRWENIANAFTESVLKAYNRITLGL